MSRSYKKNPILTDGSAGSTKRSKRCANHRVRRTSDKEIPMKGSGFKKLFESYDIHDFVIRWTWQDAVDWWEKNEWIREKYPTKKSLYQWWIKNHKTK